MVYTLLYNEEAKKKNIKISEIFFICYGDSS